jgi:hypothetical protein
MKTQFLSIIGLGLTLSLPGFAAGLSASKIAKLDSDRVGNGGFAHVCRNKKGKITSARLLDLWEADSLRPYDGPLASELQIEAALLKLKLFSPNAYQAVGYWYDQLKGAVVKTPRPLSKTEDAFPPYEPKKGCTYEQVARFEPVLTETGTSGLRIYSEIYDSPHFSNSDRAALFIHEAVYLVDRLRNEATNSQRARTLTAHLMSESEVPDAVRMLFSYLIGANRADEGNTPVIAVPNPLAMKVSAVRIYDVDGISYDSIEGNQGKQKYRCTLGEMFSRAGEPGFGDTGYQSLEKLVSYNQRFPLAATIGTNEHQALEEKETLRPAFGREDDHAIMNAIAIQCYKKDAKGQEVKVEFTAAIIVEGARCMTVSENGSTFVESGEACEMQVEGTKKFNREYPQLPLMQSIAVVRAAVSPSK